MNDLSKNSTLISFGEQENSWLARPTYGIPFNEVKRIKHLLLTDNLNSAALNVLLAVKEDGSITSGNPLMKELEVVLRSINAVRSQERVLSNPEPYSRVNLPTAQPTTAAAEGSFNLTT